MPAKARVLLKFQGENHMRHLISFVLAMLGIVLAGSVAAQPVVESTYRPP